MGNVHKLTSKIIKKGGDKVVSVKGIGQVKVDNELFEKLDLKTCLVSCRYDKKLDKFFIDKYFNDTINRK